jgi:hypothetical protein
MKMQIFVKTLTGKTITLDAEAKAKPKPKPRIKARATGAEAEVESGQEPLATLTLGGVGADSPPAAPKPKPRSKPRATGAKAKAEVEALSHQPSGSPNKRWKVDTLEATKSAATDMEERLQRKRSGEPPERAAGQT